MIDSETSTRNEHGELFGAWLKARVGEESEIGQLAGTVAKDRRFRTDSTCNDLRKLLNEDQASGDMFDIVDSAEADWLND
jgi:hypothetical protein